MSSQRPHGLNPSPLPHNPAYSAESAAKSAPKAGICYPNRNNDRTNPIEPETCGFFEQSCEYFTQKSDRLLVGIQISYFQQRTSNLRSGRARRSRPTTNGYPEKVGLPRLLSQQRSEQHCVPAMPKSKGQANGTHENLIDGPLVPCNTYFRIDRLLGLRHV